MGRLRGPRRLRRPRLDRVERARHLQREGPRVPAPRGHEQHPLQRYGTEAEVSAPIVFLLAPAAAFVTGSCVRVDGGAPNHKPGWWPLGPTRNHEPYDGFHRSTAPRILGVGSGTDDTGETDPR